MAGANAAAAALALPEASQLALRRAGLLTIGRVARQHMPALAARFGEGIKHAMLGVSAIALLAFGLYQLSKAVGVLQ